MKKGSLTEEEVDRISMQLTGTINDVIEVAAGGPGRLGFALLLFEFGRAGTKTFASNAQRDDVIRVLEGLLGELRGGN